MRGRRGRTPGEMGAGGVQGAGEGGQEVGFPRWWEAGKKRENYATLYDILQSKKCKEAGANEYRAGTGVKGFAGGLNPLSPPPPPRICPFSTSFFFLFVLRAQFDFFSFNPSRHFTCHVFICHFIVHTFKPTNGRDMSHLNPVVWPS